MSNHYFVCGATTAAGNRCPNGVPSKGMRCGLHLTAKPPRAEQTFSTPRCSGLTTQGQACQRRVFNDSGLCVTHEKSPLLDEALDAAERAQADLAIVTRALRDMKARVP